MKHVCPQGTSTTFMSLQMEIGATIHLKPLMREFLTTAAATWPVYYVILSWTSKWEFAHTLSCKDLKKNILMRGSLPYFCNSPSSSVLISLFPFHHLLRTGSSSMGTHIRKYRQERVWRRKRLAIHSMRSGLFVTSSRLQEEIKKTRIEQRSCGRRKSRMLRHHHLLSHLNMWFIKNRVTLKMLVVQQTPFLFQQPSSWEDLLNKKDVSRNGFPCDLFRSFSPSFALLSF